MFFSVSVTQNIKHNLNLTSDEGTLLYWLEVTWCTTLTGQDCSLSQGFPLIAKKTMHMESHRIIWHQIFRSGLVLPKMPFDSLLWLADVLKLVGWEQAFLMALLNALAPYIFWLPFVSFHQSHIKCCPVDLFLRGPENMRESNTGWN